MLSEKLCDGLHLTRVRTDVLTKIIPNLCRPPQRFAPAWRRIGRRRPDCEGRDSPSLIDVPTRNPPGFGHAELMISASYATKTTRTSSIATPGIKRYASTNNCVRLPLA